MKSIINILSLNRKSILKSYLPLTRYFCSENALIPNVALKVPKSEEEYLALSNSEPETKDVRQLNIAMIGLANVGKSSLTNALIKRDISGISKKAHSTRHQSTYIYSENGIQLIFLDTPGLISPSKQQKDKLEPQLLMDPMKSFRKADLSMVVVDANSKWQSERLPEIVVKLLKTYEMKDSILVLNKIDLIKEKRKLLSVVDNLTRPEVHSDARRTRNPNDKIDLQALLDKHKQCEKVEEDEKEFRDYWPNFSKIFMVSSEDDDGIEDLRDYLMSQAKPAKWRHGLLLTDNKPQDIAKDIIRSEYMNILQKNVPYLLSFKIILWKFSAEGVLNVWVDVICPRESLMKSVIGPGGENIKQVKHRAAFKLTKIFECPVELEILAKSYKKKYT